MSNSLAPKAVHPDIELLRACALGVLPVSTQALIRFHVNNCDICHASVEEMEVAEGAKLADMSPVDPQRNGRDDIIRRVRAVGLGVEASELIEELQSPQPLRDAVPPAVQSLLQGFAPTMLRSLKWRAIAVGVRLSRLCQGGERLTVVSLETERSRMPEARARVTQHALVLEGLMQVGTGTYKEGDFLTWLAGESWSPANASRARCVFVAGDVRALRFKRWYTNMLVRFYRVTALHG